MEFSRQEYWTGLPFPSPRDLPYPGIEPRSSALRADTLPSAYVYTHMHTQQAYTNIYLHTSIHMHTHTYTYRYTHTLMHAHMHTQSMHTHAQYTHIYIHTSTHMYIHAHTKYTQTCAYIHKHTQSIHIHTQTQTYTQVYTCTHTYTYKDTHTQMYTCAHTSHSHSHTHTYPRSHHPGLLASQPLSPPHLLTVFSDEDLIQGLPIFLCKGQDSKYFPGPTASMATLQLCNGSANASTDSV